MQYDGTEADSVTAEQELKVADLVGRAFPERILFALEGTEARITHVSGNEGRFASSGLRVGGAFISFWAPDDRERIRSAIEAVGCSPGGSRVVSGRCATDMCGHVTAGLYHPDLDTEEGGRIIVGYLEPHSPCRSVTASPMPGRLFDGSGVGYILIDRTYGIVDFNAVADRMSVEFFGRPLRHGKLLVPQDVAGDEIGIVFDGFRRAFGGEEFVRDWSYTHGSLTRQIAVTHVPVDGRDGEVEFVALLYSDVTGLRRQARENLQLRVALDESPLGIALAEADGTVVYVNRRLAELTGYAEEELLHQSLEPLLPGKPEDEVRRAFWTTLKQGNSWSSEIDSYRRDHQYYRERSITSPVMDGEGNLNAITFITRDVTEEYRIRRELEEKKSRFKALFEYAHDAVYIHRMDGTIEECNLTACEQTGYRREELIGQPISLLDPTAGVEPEVVIGSIVGDKNILEGRSSARFNSRHYRKDGSSFPVEIGAAVFSVNSEPVVLATVRDVSEREATLERLRRSEARFRGVVDSSPIGILFADVSMIVRDYNSALRPLIGMGPQDTLGDTGLADSSELFGVPLGDWLEDLGSCGCVKERELRRNGRDGRELDLRLLARVVTDDEDQLVGYLLMAEDITERKAKERALSELLREKESLLRELHHRVKNNLQSMASLLRLQRDQVVDPADQEILERNIDRFHSMASAHQLLYQAESLHHIDLEEYVKELLSYATRAANAGQGSASAVYRAVVNVPGDPPRLDLEQAIPLGLLVNELIGISTSSTATDARERVLLMELGYADDRLSIVYRDSGAHPATALLQAPEHAFSAELATLLTAQLQGKLDAEEDTRFRVVIVFERRSRPPVNG